jgi:acyl carrier protein
MQVMTEQEIKSTVKTYILNEFLPGEDAAALTDTTALISTGILDSIALLNVVGFLEKQFGITLQAYETTVEHLNTLSDIARLVAAKQS